MPTGHDAPWRGSRITRTSWQKYLPPNCAPMPFLRVMSSTCCSSSRSRNARPLALPLVGSESRYLALASLTVFSVYSADMPPITIARWYGGQAAVPSFRVSLSMKASSVFGFSSALVS